MKTFYFIHYHDYCCNRCEYSLSHIIIRTKNDESFVEKCFTDDKLFELLFYPQKDEIYEYDKKKVNNVFTLSHSDCNIFVYIKNEENPYVKLKSLLLEKYKIKKFEQLEKDCFRCPDGTILTDENTFQNILEKLSDSDISKVMDIQNTCYYKKYSINRDYYVFYNIEYTTKELILIIIGKKIDRLPLFDRNILGIIIKY